MAEQNAQAVKTCTIGFDVGSLDERQYADHVARRFATDHRTRIVSPDDYGLLDRLVGHFDEPQCISVCPVECIDPDPDHPESQEQLLAKLAQLQAEGAAP